MRILNKSQAAFIMSAREFFRKEKVVFFWTFTFPRCMPDWYYPRSWNVFIKIMQNHYGGFLQGLRVVEVHPNGHGLHYHAIVNQRMSVHIVRRLWGRAGGGHVQVDVATPASAEYLAKYLTKNNPLWPGMRRWGTIGGFRQVKVKNIVVESAFHRNVWTVGRGKRLPIVDISWIYGQSKLWGEFHEWPEEQKQNLRNRLDNRGKDDKVLSVERKVLERSKRVTLCDAPF